MTAPSRNAPSPDRDQPNRLTLAEWALVALVVVASAVALCGFAVAVVVLWG